MTTNEPNETKQRETNPIRCPKKMIMRIGRKWDHLQMHLTADTDSAQATSRLSRTNNAIGQPKKRNSGLRKAAFPVKPHSKRATSPSTEPSNEQQTIITVTTESEARYRNAGTKDKWKNRRKTLRLYVTKASLTNTENTNSSSEHHRKRAKTNNLLLTSYSIEPAAEQQTAQDR